MAGPPPTPGESPPPGSRCIPSRSGTFFTPCEVRASDLDHCEDVYIDSLARPKAVLVPRAPLGDMSLAGSSAVLDMQDFGGRAEDKRDTGAADLVQTREHVFTLTRDGVLNCLGVFLWVDLGIGGAAAPTAAPEPAKARRAAEGGAESFAHRFPFGAGDGAGKAASAAAARGTPLNDFTSLCTPGTLREKTHATNWMNPILLLPTPTAVVAGDRLRVRSRSSADSDTPSYAFELEYLPKGAQRKGKNVVPLGSLEIGMGDIYPFYDN